MMKKNKKGFTLLELIIVIGILILLLHVVFNSKIGKSTLGALEKQTINDQIVTVVSEVKNYSYNNITIFQELLKNGDIVNQEVSRFNNNGAKIDNSTSKVAYYHSLYFTTNSTDNIDNEFGTNKNIYLLQYRQEGLTNLQNRIFESFNINYQTSNQLFYSGLTKWSKKYKFQTSKTYFLNKIIQYNNLYKDNINLACENPSTINSFYIRFSVSNLNYDFFVNNLIDKNFDYILCFSNTENEFDNGFGLRINRTNLEELYLEKIRNY